MTPTPQHSIFISGKLGLAVATLITHERMLVTLHQGDLLLGGEYAGHVVVETTDLDTDEHVTTHLNGNGEIVKQTVNGKAVMA